MRKYLFLLVLASVVAQADIYRIVDEHGNVSYSDKADSRAEQVELEEPSTYAPAPVQIDIKKSDAVNEQSSLDIPAYQLTITSPQHDESIWENAGTITVNVIITPELSTERGDQLIFKIDGNQIGLAQSSTSLIVENMERGSHIALVMVVDKSAKVIRQSKSVLFHIHRNMKSNAL